MNENNSNEVATIDLESNVMKKGFFYSFATRNVVEALILAGIVCYIITSINFTNFVKTIYVVVFGGGTFFFTARGYKNRSFLQTAHDYAHVLRTRKQLHLRGSEYARQNIKIQEGEGSDLSIAQQLYEKFRKRLSKFVDEYGEEEAGEQD